MDTFVVEQLDIATADIGLSHQMTAVTVPSDAPWPRKLEAAQNVIFCKEVYAQVVTLSSDLFTFVTSCLTNLGFRY